MEHALYPTQLNNRKVLIVFLCLFDVLILVALGLLGPLGAFIGVTGIVLLIYLSNSPIILVASVILTSFIVSVPGVDSHVISSVKHLLLVSFLLLTIVRLMIEKKTWTTDFGGFEKAILLFAFWIGITTVTALRPYQSLKVFFNIVILITLYFATIETISKRAHVRLLFYLALIAATATFLFTAYTFLNNPFSRATGFFTNSNILGKLAITLTPFLAMGALTSSNWREKVIFRLGIIMTMFFLALTWSRGSWLGMIGFTITFLWFEKRRLLKILTLSVAIVSVLLLLYDPFLNMIYKIGRIESGTTRRSVYWEYATLTAFDRPIFGQGFGTRIRDIRNQKELTDIQEYAALKETEKNFNAHNMFLHLVVTTGFPGLILIIFICYYLFKRHTFKRRIAPTTARRLLHTTVIGVLIASLLSGLFDIGPLIGQRSISAYMWVFLGLAAAVEKKNIDI